uniref:threonine--tRNA ligase n=1 Tax=Araucaria cunninghamii TaxID=56994 RepID=A0A0D6QR99_ARACU
MGFASSSYRVHRMAMVTSVLLQPTLSQSSNPARKLLLNLKSGQCAGSHLSLRRSRGVLENPYGLGWIRILSANRIKCKRLATIATLAAPQEAPTKTEGDEVYKQVVLPTNETSETLVLIRHTSAHVLAMAVQKAFPNAKVTIGPWIERGFYYDFDMQPVTDQDLKKIKKEMDRIINRNLPLIREEVSRQEAERRIKAINEPYKLEILESIKSEPITIYHIGDEWWDLCAGPHVESTGQLNKKAIELESVAGAYWRGDEKRPMLQRIYGTAWESEEQLKAYQFLREEAKRRDHRRLGQELDLFSIQDDAHVFCLPSQIKGEIRSVLDLTEKVLSQFGFKKYEVNLSTKPEKAVGPDDIWEKATSALEDALKDKGWAYSVDEGGGAFYGPKIDLKIEDALGRKWQCSTVQVDFNLPHRFDLSYVDTNSEKSQPIMIHRAILGSLERFFGILIENYAGDFPLWLSPVQARLLPVTDTQVPYCQKVVEKMKEKNIRAEVSYGERLSKLIRNAETQKVPLMAVVGPKEVESETLTVRTRHGGELGTMKIDQVIEKIEQAVTARSFV